MNKEAEQKLKAQKEQAVELLEAITTAVKKYGDGGESINYSHVGSLSRLITDLEELAEFLNARKYMARYGDRFVADKLRVIKPKK